MQKSGGLPAWHTFNNVSGKSRTIPGWDESEPQKNIYSLPSNNDMTEGSRTESARKGGSHGLPSVGYKPCQKVSSGMVARSIPSSEGKPTPLAGGRMPQAKKRIRY